MSPRAAEVILISADGAPVKVEDRTYYTTRVDRQQNGTYRLEASEVRGERPRWLIRGKGLWCSDVDGVWRFIHYATVVELER